MKPRTLSNGSSVAAPTPTAAEHYAALSINKFVPSQATYAPNYIDPVSKTEMLINKRMDNRLSRATRMDGLFRIFYFIRLVRVFRIFKVSRYLKWLYD